MIMQFKYKKIRTNFRVMEKKHKIFSQEVLATYFIFIIIFP